MADNNSTITPPVGFVLDSASSTPPVAPPSGFVLDSQAPQTQTPAPTITPPSGFVLDSSRPDNGQPAPEDPNAPWYKKAWDFANTPLTESLLGWGGSRQGSSGVEKGAEEVASGFTSPLSLALTLATFGTAGFLESAGANVLKQAGLSAAEIADVGRGAEVVTNAVKTGKGIDASLEAANIKPSFYHGAMDNLYNAGLKEADLTSGNLVERGASQIARKVGATPLQSQNIAKGLQTLASTGFTLQAAQTASEMSPRVLDALKEGDYDHAAEYATEAIANGLFAVAGGSHALRSAGELVDPILSTKLRPTDEALNFKKQHDIRDGDVSAAQEQARLLEEASLKALGHKDPRSPLTSQATTDGQLAQLAKMYHGMTLGFDKDLAAQHYNAVAEAAGREDRLPTGDDRLIPREQAVEAIKQSNSRQKFQGNPEGVEALANSIPKGDFVLARVPVSDLNAEATYPDVVNQYATQQGPLSPSYGKFEDGKVFVEDGNHRAEAAKQRGESSIGVIMPKADYDQYKSVSPDNGQARALIQNSPEFAKWFNGSQAVDDKGTPKLLFHGTNRAGFSEFNKDTLSPDSLYGPGVYMTESPSVASEYADTVGSRGQADYSRLPEYYKPGNIVPSFGGQDRVLEYRPPADDKGWWVKVQAVDKNGKDLNEPPRWHHTSPDAINMSRVLNGSAGKAVYPLYASLQKPFDTTGSIPRAEAQQIFGQHNSSGWLDEAYGSKSSISGEDLYHQATKALYEDGKEPGFGDFIHGPEAVNSLLEKAGYDGIKYTGGSLRGASPHQVWVAFDPAKVKSAFDTHGVPFEKPHAALPPNVRELVASSDLKSKPADYIDKLLASYRGVHEGLSTDELTVAKNLRDKLDKGFEDAAANDLMSSRIENYMRRIWKTPSPEVNTAIHDANNGRFATDVSMAKHRVFTDELTPILKGYELQTEDPVRLSSQYLADTYKVIANRNLQSRVLDLGLRASDGRPAAVLQGIGHTVETPNPATLITPTRIRNIRISDPEIQRLQSSGDLQRHLDSGSIEDVTPKARPWNLSQTIDRLEQKMVSAPVKFDEEGNSVALRDIQLLKDVRDGKRPPSDLDEFNQSQKPVYVWRPQDYIKVDHPSLRSWNFLTSDPDGNPVIAKSGLAVHPEYADYFKNRLGLDESALQKWGPTKALLKGGALAKRTLLSLSPFHMNQEALRAVMMGVNPLMKTAPTIEESPDLRRMVEQGLTLEPDYKGLQEHSEGLTGGSKLIGKVPVVGQTLAKSLDWYEHFLFQKYIPNLKARAALLMNDRYSAAHPDWTPDKVAEVAARHVNDNFGGQNWRAMGRSATTQDWLRITTLAPDWLLSELQSTARLFNREAGGIARSQVLKMAMGLWGTARVLNMVSTGHPHLEAPFGLAVKNDQGKDVVYSMRTLPTDILHMVSDPTGFLKGRLSPELRAAEEVYSGRDQFGRKLPPSDLAVDLFRNISPIPLQAVGQAVSGTGPEVGTTGQVVKALGGTATTYRTQAQQLASNLASNHSEDGPVDEAQLHRHRILMNFEDQLRQGTMSQQQLYGLVLSGQLPQADAKKITENLRQTRQLTPDMASLYTRAARLPAKELLDVYDISTPHEQQALAPLILKARKSYVKRALTTETPQERMRDPVLRRLTNVHTDQPLF